MKRVFLISALTLCLTAILPQALYAKRLLPRATKSKTSAVASKAKGVTTSVKFRADRKAIIVNFSNLGIASSVSYFLSYTTRGTTQGVNGTIQLDDSSTTTREILFGTCSAGVCRYDTNITNAKFTVTTTLKSGKKVLKPYKLKI